jgi:Fe-S-cluster containining protein
MDYVEANAEPQGVKCKWLDETHAECVCTAYARRGDDCRNYPGNVCKVGPYIQLKKALQGKELAPETLARIQALPRYKHYEQAAQDAIILEQRIAAEINRTTIETQ